MFAIGCHLSASKGFLAMGKEALSIGADTFQFFTRNPRGSRAKELDMDDIASFLAFAENRIRTPLAHAPYTLNPASADERIREFALLTLADDLKRLSHLPGSLYNLHPGSHVGQGTEPGIKQITEVLNHILWAENKTPLLLETMSGKGSEVGSRFEELRDIMNGVEYQEQVGICLDTCHVYAAGYDIVNELDGVLEEFDRIIGLEKLRAIHLNDSMHPMGSHKDRHAKIGEGTIGFSAFCRIVNHPALQNVPFYLETPQETVTGYAEEIKRLREVRK
ncbi:MAG: deoxyribonuclease IV [Clostridia bacterium]|nr:deoxyribonuclease IV [Clostridia bacterium]